MLWLVTTIGLLLSTIWLLTHKKSFKKAAIPRKAVLESLGRHDASSTRLRFVGFFHPYCNAGGGGERVLWAAIAFVQRTEPDVISVVYTGDKGVTKEDIIHKVKTRFDVVLNPTSLYFVFLESRYLVEDVTWPMFTLLGQSLGSIYLAWEALSKFIPDMFVDTMGYAFTFYPVRLLANIPVGAYVHYPTISTEMLHRVRSRKVWHTNSKTITSSTVLSRGKQLYYRIFMFYYSLSLHNASFLMVNSTWTKSHVDAVLNYVAGDRLMSTVHLAISRIACGVFPFLRVESAPNHLTRVVYPSCDTKRMSTFQLTGRSRTIVSLAQFRPEKDHATQLHAFAELFKARPEYESGSDPVRLVLMGSSRDGGDAARVGKLKSLASELGIQNNVDFVVNAPFSVLLDQLSRASVGLSTMIDEHFGINVVEFMAAGLIPVVHASGGPLNDIVVPRNGQPTGFLCTTPTTFANALHEALSLSSEEDLAIRKRAREHAVGRFSEREFELGWERSGWAEWIDKVRLRKS